VFRGGCFYLNFNVVSANSANTSDAIQKRTITFDSDTPAIQMMMDRRHLKNALLTQLVGTNLQITDSASITKSRQ